MEARELNEMAWGYTAGNVLMKNMSNKLKRETERLQEVTADLKQKREQYELKHPSVDKISAEIAKFLLKEITDEAFGYLNDLFMEEAIDFAQSQSGRRFCLSTDISNLKAKYEPFYKKLDRDIPENLKNLTDESLCSLLNIAVLKRKDDAIVENEKDTEDVPKDNTGAIVGICVSVFVLLIVFLTCLGV